MKKHLINFPENNISIESFYDRLRPCYDSIMQFGDRVLVAQMNWNGMLGAFARSGGFFRRGNTHKSDKKRCV